MVRVWLPDRPGALGAVASRIGAVRGDVVGIDILERGAGKAIDELVVQLPDAGLLDLLIAEVKMVDGVAVEDVRPAAEWLRDPRLDALETAARLVAATTVDDLLEALVASTMHDFGAGWVAVVDLDTPELCHAVGAAPTAAWLAAFLEGSRSSARLAAGEAGPDELAWAPMDAAHLTLAVGRSGRPVRARERRQVMVLARIADTRWVEVSLDDAVRSHPSSAP